MPSLDTLVARIRGEYREMPGLRLTVAQARRLSQLDAGQCDAVLEALIAEGFLVRTHDAAYMALPSTPGSLKAALTPIRLRHSA